MIRPASRRITLLLDSAAAAALPPPDANGQGSLEIAAMILAGDVGGTKVDLALCKFDRGQLLTVHDHKYSCQGFPGLVQVVEAFLDECKQSLGQPRDVLAACFGVPGPVRHGRLKLTNLPWVLDADQLAVDLKIEHVFLINDLEANGYGIRRADAGPDSCSQQGRPGSGRESRPDCRRHRAWEKPSWCGMGTRICPWPPKAATATLPPAMKKRLGCCAICKRTLVAA